MTDTKYTTPPEDWLGPPRHYPEIWPKLAPEKPFLPPFPTESAVPPSNRVWVRLGVTVHIDGLTPSEEDFRIAEEGERIRQARIKKLEIGDWVRRRTEHSDEVFKIKNIVRTYETQEDGRERLTSVLYNEKYEIHLNCSYHPIEWVDPISERERKYRDALRSIENYELAVMKAIRAGQFVPDGSSYIPEWCRGSESGEFDFLDNSAKNIFDWVRSHEGKNESN